MWQHERLLRDIVCTGTSSAHGDLSRVLASYMLIVVCGSRFYSCIKISCSTVLVNVAHESSLPADVVSTHRRRFSSVHVPLVKIIRKSLGIWNSFCRGNSSAEYKYLTFCFTNIAPSANILITHIIWWFLWKQLFIIKLKFICPHTWLSEYYIIVSIKSNIVDDYNTNAETERQE